MNARVPGQPGEADEALPDVRDEVGRLSASGARRGDEGPVGPARGPTPLLPGRGEARRARARAVRPTGGNLVGCLLLAVLAAVVTGPSGSAADPLAGARGSLDGGRGLGFLAGGLVAWLAWAGAPALRAPVRGAADRVLLFARERVAARRDRSGLRRRRARRRRGRLRAAVRALRGAAGYGARVLLAPPGRRRRARLNGRPSLADAVGRPNRLPVLPVPDPDDEVEVEIIPPCDGARPLALPGLGGPAAGAAPGGARRYGPGDTATAPVEDAVPVPPWHRTWAARSKWTVRVPRARGAAQGLTAPETPPAGPGARWRRGSAARAAGWLLLVAVAGLAPLAVSTAAQQAMVNDIGLYALLALGLNVVVGYAGLLDLGYIAFFAIGAYTAAYLCSPDAMPWHAPFTINPFLAMPVAVAVAALAGLALGAPTLRLRGDYLAIVTLGFGEIVQLLANNADGITGGARGVFGVPPLSVSYRGFHYTWGLAPLPYYYLLVVLVIAVIAVLGVWERSRTGRAWAAIRQDEIAAAASGVRTLRMKLLAFAIGASVSGFAGVVLASKQFFNPQTFSLQASLLVLTVVIFGGMGSRLGVVVGAVVLQGLAFFLRDRVPAADRYVYFGAIVMVMMVFRPQGLVPPRQRPPGPRPDPAAPPPRHHRRRQGAGAAAPPATLAAGPAGGTHPDQVIEEDR